MMKSIKHLVFGLSVISCGALAASELAVADQKKSNMLAQNNNGSQKKNGTVKQDPDATFCLPESGGTATAEFLWWSTNYNLPYWVQGFDTSSDTQISATPYVRLTTNDVFVKVIRAGQKWSPGVRLSIGYVPGYDNMDIQGRWTYYQNHAHSHKGGSELTQNFSNGTVEGISSAKLSLQLVQNVADFELGKSYFTGSKVLLRPFCGVRAAWLHQNHHATYINAPFRNPNDGFTTDEQPIHVKIKQKLWAVGPRIGLNTSWFKYCGLSVLANLSTSLLYGEAHQGYNLEVNTANTNSDQIGPYTNLQQSRATAHDKFGELFPHLQLILGASWERCITRDLSVKLFAAWESNFWWEASNVLFFERSLSTQGLTTGIGVTF